MGILCHLYQKQLVPLASGELSEPRVARLTRHLATCPTCQREWEAQQQLTHALFQAAPVPQLPSPLLWERLEAQILRESQPTPLPSPSRARLAPLGGLALAAAAVAAVSVTRPPQVSAPSPAPQVAVAQERRLPPTPPSPAPKRPSALELGKRADVKVARNIPTRDPFSVGEAALPPAPRSSERVVQSLRGSRPRVKQLPRQPEGDIPSYTKAHAIRQFELGTTRLQTAELNREVREAELSDPSPAQRASCAPTEALASARGEASMGIFQ